MFASVRAFCMSYECRNQSRISQIFFVGVKALKNAYGVLIERRWRELATDYMWAGSIVSSLSGVWGGAPAAKKDFVYFEMETGSFSLCKSESVNWISSECKKNEPYSSILYEAWLNCTYVCKKLYYTHDIAV